TPTLTNSITYNKYLKFSGFVNGSLGYEVLKTILSGISGKNPTTAKSIFSTRNNATSTYIRNTGCWAYNLDLTPAPVYSSHGGASYGALITPRHLLFAWHAAIPSGAELRFVTQNNTVITKTVKGRAFMTGASLVADLGIAALDSDVPTGVGGINFCYV